MPSAVLSPEVSAYYYTPISPMPAFAAERQPQKASARRNSLLMPQVLIEWLVFPQTLHEAAERTVTRGIDKLGVANLI